MNSPAFLVFNMIFYLTVLSFVVFLTISISFKTFQLMHFLYHRIHILFLIIAQNFLFLQ